MANMSKVKVPMPEQDPKVRAHNFEEANPQNYRGKIEAINKAIDSDLTINMTYTDNKDFCSVRDFDPYCLVLKEGIWYVYGYCHLRNDFRLFRLARIQRLTISENTFLRKESDVYEKLNGTFDDTDLVDIEFEFFSTALSEVEEWLGPDAISERGTSYIAKASVFGGSLLINKLLSFGSSIKILKPQALKEPPRRNSEADGCTEWSPRCYGQNG